MAPSEDGRSRSPRSEAPPPGACGCHVQEGGAGASDSDGTVRDNRGTIRRLRRIEGQIRGLQRMIEENRYCADVMTQISSAHEALRAVARDLMRSHLRHCATTATSELEAEDLYDELIEMVYRLGR